MATGANVTIAITGVDALRAKLERIKWGLVDGRDVLTEQGYRGRVTDVLELGAIPDTRLLAAAHLERFVAGCPDALYEWTPGPAMQAGALGPRYRGLIDQGAETIEIMARLRAPRALPLCKNFIAEGYDVSLELAGAGETITERLGKIGIVVGSTSPVGSPAWQRDKLLWYGYPDWTPDRVDDWLFRFYGWLPDRAVSMLYDLMLGKKR